MGHILAWYNLLFLIPLLGGLLLGVGMVLGLGGSHDASDGADGGHGELFASHGHIDHVGHDSHGHPHPHDAAPDAGPLSLFGLGQVPLTIALMLAAMLFGGSGAVFNMVLIPALHSPARAVLLSLLGASLVTVLLCSRLTRLLARLLPTFETYRISRSDLIGCGGKLLNDADAESVGYAQIRDGEGNIHNITCRAYLEAGKLVRGQDVMVIDYDEERNVYHVEAATELDVSLTAAASRTRRPGRAPRSSAAR